MKKTLVAAAILAAPLMASPAVSHADTVCQSSPNTVVAGDGTSCPFALTIARSYMYGHNGPSFSAYSDATNESYDVTCRIEQQGSTTCRTNPGTGVVVIY